MRRTLIAALGTLVLAGYSSNANADAASDTLYCASLSNLFKTYGTAISVEGHFQPHSAAIEYAMTTCDTNPAAAIPVLEAAVRSTEVSLTQRRVGPVLAPPPVIAEVPATPKLARATPLKPEDRIAAQRGNALAQYDLGRRYEEGEGVPQDFALAHMWFNLSASCGTPVGPLAEQAREEIERSMTREQVAEAQGMARTWRRAQ